MHIIDQVTSESDVANALSVTKERFGTINTAVNCAGRNKIKRKL